MKIEKLEIDTQFCGSYSKKLTFRDDLRYPQNDISILANKINELVDVINSTVCLKSAPEIIESFRKFLQKGDQ